MNTQLLDQIIWDSEMTLEDELNELHIIPENFINVLYEKSYDEMTRSEKEEAIAEIEAYLIENFN